MANDPIALTGRWAALGLAALLAACLWPLFWSLAGAAVAPSLWAALRFTLWQAFWSALLSCLLGVFLARALFRRRFWGRAAVIRLLSAPFILPALAAVLGLLMIFGRSGLLSTLLARFGLPPLSIYGPAGVVLAHVFLNLPLATRMILMGWQSIPGERFRLAQSLRFLPLAVFWHLDLPMLRAVLPSAFSAIFLICLTSFAVALTLGGGPRASTVELAIYQSLRFEFNLQGAAQAALMQGVIGLLALALATMFWRPLPLGAGLDRPIAPPPAPGWRFVADVLVIGLALLFLGLPLLALLGAGLPALPILPAGFWPAAALSILIALVASAGAMALALALVWARAKGAGVWVEIAAMMPLAISSLALGTGGYLAAHRIISPSRFALPAAMLFTAIMALPYLFRLLRPACDAALRPYSRLTAELRLSPMAEFRLLALPRMRAQIGFGMGLAAAMAMGDFGVLALFGGQGHITLPILISQLMGSYQIAAAAAATLGLIALSLALFWGFDRWGARGAKG